MTTPETASPQLSIIIPAYNEGRRLGPALKQLREYFESSPLRAEVIVVDDGSVDDTCAVAEAFEPGPLMLRVIRNRTNRGKGYSVRRGMRRAAGLELLMTDTDQSTPIWEIERLRPHLADGYDVVIGSRDVSDSHITRPQPWHRHVMGFLMRGFRRRVMLADLRDTQCGFKLFSRQAAQAIFPRLRESGFAFDCEALLLARKLGYRIKEVGVVWCNDEDSRVRPFRDAVGVLASLFKIRWRLRGMKSPANSK